MYKPHSLLERVFIMVAPREIPMKDVYRCVQMCTRKNGAAIKEFFDVYKMCTDVYKMCTKVCTSVRGVYKLGTLKCRS